MKEEWFLCPKCQSKTRLKIRENTELKNFPLLCPKCRQEVLISVKQFHMSIINEPRHRADNTQILWLSALYFNQEDFSMGKLLHFLSPYKKRITLMLLLLFFQVLGTLYIPTLTAGMVKQRYHFRQPGLCLEHKRSDASGRVSHSSRFRFRNLSVNLRSNRDGPGYSGRSVSQGAGLFCK